MYKRTVIFTMACCISAPLFMSCGDDSSGSSDKTQCEEGCGEGQHCDEAKGECVADTPAENECPADCGAGRHCDEAKGECVADTPIQKVCPADCGEGKHCDESKGECVDDTPAEKTCPSDCGAGRHCDESTGFECVDDTPAEIECEDDCLDGYHCDKARGECVEDIECAEVCSEEQHCNFGTGMCEDNVEDVVIECIETCGIHQHCDTSVGQCVADEKDCTEDGQLICSGTLLMRCGSDGYYELAEDCADNADAGKACYDNGESGFGCYDSECVPGETKCAGSKILKCNDYHKYVDDSDCADLTDTPVCSDTVGAAACVAKCTVGTSQCTDNQVEVCDEVSGKYVVSGDCPKTEGICKLDDNGAAFCKLFECKEGDLRCSGDSLEKCNAGFYEVSSNCADVGFICTEEGGASCKDVDCRGEESKCVGDKWVFKCNHGTYDETNCYNAFASSGNKGKCVTNVSTGNSVCVEIKSIEDGYDESMDTDKDTIMDGIESCTNDQDHDGKVDCEDEDSDGDTIPDKLEADNAGGDEEPGDADYDGVPNYLDLDSDGNGIPDSIECCGGDAACLAAKDANGLFSKCIDTDGDNIPDFLDYDNDGDGIDDVKEIEGMVINPPEPEAGTFSGYGCVNGNARGSADHPVDCDNDTIPDYMDFDSDNDGLCDDTEGLLRMNVIGKDNKKHGSYARYNKDTDGDGINDLLEALGKTKLASTDKPDAKGCYSLTGASDADKDGFVNQLEVDSDDDGLSDRYETMCCGLTELNPDEKAECVSNNNWCTNPYKADSDGDGVTDLIEFGAETDPNKASDNPQSKGNFVFRAPYQQATTPNVESLALELSIQTIDIFFNFDQSSSTKDEAKKLNEKLPNSLKKLQCEDLKKDCIENSDCNNLQNAAGQIVEDAICSEKNRCIVNPKSGDGCFDDMEVGLGYYYYIDTFWVAVPLGEKQSTSSGTLSNVDTVVTALKRYYPSGDNEVAFQAPICAAESTPNYCKTKSGYNNTCKPASDACKNLSYKDVSGKTTNAVSGCYNSCKRNCVDLTANPDRETCVGYRKSAIRIYAQVFDEEQCRGNSGAASRCVEFFEKVGPVMKENKMRWIGLQSSSSTSSCTVSPKTSSSTATCIDDLCETVCSDSNRLYMSAVSDYIGKQSGSTSLSGTPYTYTATGDDIDVKFEQGVREIAKSMPMDITAEVEDLDSGENLNASRLVSALNVHITGGQAQGKNCFNVPSGKIEAGTFQGIHQIAPIEITDGFSVCYDVIPVQNQTLFVPDAKPVVKKARITIKGDGSPLNSGIAYFLIPPKIEDNSGEIGND